VGHENDLAFGADLGEPALAVYDPVERQRNPARDLRGKAGIGLGEAVEEFLERPRFHLHLGLPVRGLPERTPEPDLDHLSPRAPSGPAAATSATRKAGSRPSARPRWRSRPKAARSRFRPRPGRRWDG